MHHAAFDFNAIRLHLKRTQNGNRSFNYSVECMQMSSRVEREKIDG